MDIKELKDLTILICGKFKQLKIEGNNLIISDGHYSTGSKFEIHIRDNINLLSYKGKNLRLKPNNSISIDNEDQFDIFYPLITLTQIDLDGEAYKLGYKGGEGWLNQNFIKCTEEEALKIQLTWPQLISSSDLVKYTKLLGIQNQFTNQFVSIDGIPLLSNNFNFSMILDYSLIKQPFNHHYNNELFWDCDHSNNIKFKFKYINNRVILYSPSLGYLESRFLEGYNSDIACFTDKLPASPVALFPTSTVGEYKLASEDKLVSTSYRASWLSNKLEKDEEKASIFQFILINESYKFKNSIS